MIVELSSRLPKIISRPHLGDASPRLKNQVVGVIAKRLL